MLMSGSLSNTKSNSGNYCWQKKRAKMMMTTTMLMMTMSNLLSGSFTSSFFLWLTLLLVFCRPRGAWTIKFIYPQSDECWSHQQPAAVNALFLFHGWNLGGMVPRRPHDKATIMHEESKTCTAFLTVTVAGGAIERYWQHLEQWCTGSFLFLRIYIFSDISKEFSSKGFKRFQVKIRDWFP